MEYSLAGPVGAWSCLGLSFWQNALGALVFWLDPALSS